MDKLADLMFDPVSGGFFTRRVPRGSQKQWAFWHARKPFQDPDSAGIPLQPSLCCALRLHQQQAYREKAEQTMEVASGLVGKFGIFAPLWHRHPCTFRSRIAKPSSSRSDLADQLYAVATISSAAQSVLRLPLNEVTARTAAAIGRDHS